MIISLLIAIPIITSLLILAVPRSNEAAVRWIALLGASAAFVASLVMFFNFAPGEAGYQMVEQAPWINSIGAEWHLGVDGISLFLIMLTTLLALLCVISSWGSIHSRVKEYHFLFMLMLVGILYVYFHTMDPATGHHTFNLLLATEQAKYSLDVQTWLFLAFALAFAIKVPLFPVHTWLPDAHTEAPTAGSVMLAGILLKLGTYGFLRFCMPMFPAATVKFVPLISVLAVIGILYGALMAMIQKDIKRLVAYSSVAHLGFVMLGAFALNLEGLSGSLLQQINHGISTGALFLLVGVVYDRRHTRMQADYGGIAKVMPVYATLFLIIALSSIGLPGLNGFVGEFLILLGTFAAHPIYSVFATAGIIIAAVYLLWMYQRVFFGKVTHEENLQMKDVSLREGLVIAVLVVLAIAIGVYPDPLLSRMQPSLNLLLSHFQGAGITQTLLP